MTTLPPRRPAAPQPRSGMLTLPKLAVLTAALIAGAWWLGRNPSPPAPEAAVAVADTDSASTTANRQAPQVIRGDKPTTLSQVDRARMRVIDNGSALSVVGGVGREFARDLQAHIDAHPSLRRIDITSGGGYSVVGYDAARIIRRNNLAVRVKGHCASICVALWAAAHNRQMEANAVIGLHQWTAQCEVMTGEQRRQCEHQTQFATEITTTYEAWLRSAGFSPALIALQARTPSHDIAVVSVRELADNGVDFSVVPHTP